MLSYGIASATVNVHSRPVVTHLAMHSIDRLGRATVLFAALLFLVAPASAQGFKWWQSDLYKRELGLTVEQSRRLEDIFQAAVPNLRIQKKALDQAETEFERLVEKGDDSAVMEQVGRVEIARAELNKSRTMMLLRMRRALTTDQWAKFTALHQAAERERAEQGERGK
jgi:Spy/CpxP family protein refolding chaperone